MQGQAKDWIKKKKIVPRIIIALFFSLWVKCLFILDYFKDGVCMKTRINLKMLEFFFSWIYNFDGCFFQYEVSREGSSQNLKDEETSTKFISNQHSVWIFRVSIHNVWVAFKVLEYICNVCKFHSFPLWSCVCRRKEKVKRS